MTDENHELPNILGEDLGTPAATNRGSMSALSSARSSTSRWRIAVDAFESEYVVYHGPGDLAFTYDNLRDALVDLGRYVVACNAMHRSMERRQVLS